MPYGPAQQPNPAWRHPARPSPHADQHRAGTDVREAPRITRDSKLVNGEPGDGLAAGAVSSSFSVSCAGEVRLTPRGNGQRWPGSVL